MYILGNVNTLQKGIKSLTLEKSICLYIYIYYMQFVTMNNYSLGPVVALNCVI